MSGIAAAGPDALPRAATARGVTPSWDGLALAVGACLLVVGLAEADGGYFPVAWGWCVLALAWVAGVAVLVSPRVAFGRLELTVLGGLTALIGWTALSVLWSSDVEQSVLEVQRGLIYLVGVLAGVLLVRRRSVGYLLGGLLSGIVWISVQALGGRLLLDTGSGMVEVGRLAEPIGYFNALGILVVMGVLLALGFAVRGRHLAGRATAAAALPLLLTATYFTFSRGAAVALAIGLLAAVLADRRPFAFFTASVIVALPGAAAVWLASRQPGLTSLSAERATVADEGSKLAIALLALTVCSAGAAWIAGMIDARIHVPPAARRAYGTAFGCAAAVLLVGVVIHFGGPGPLVRDAFDHLNGTTAGTEVAAPDANDLNKRLGSIASSGRVDHWRVALDEYEQHPLLGSGAGTYEQFWLRDREEPFQARDAHSLYLETLAQLGWLGLGLVLLVLAVPAISAFRARGQPLVAGAFGAFAAYLVHTGIDWDWEVPIVTLTALLCGVALIAAASGRAPSGAALDGRRRGLVVVALVVLAAFSLIGLVGNRALADAARKVDLANYVEGEMDARKAVRWAPWSAQAVQQRGRAEVGLGRRREGRASLREAVSMRPADWRIWYDLGIASTGRERTRALVKAAALNPKEPDITVLRQRGELRRPAGASR